MRSGYAPGKIILSGEYAVLFGYSGTAIPAPIGIGVEFEEAAGGGIEIDWEGQRDERALDYARRIVSHCLPNRTAHGRLTIRAKVPIGKGMGSSTALVVAIARALCGDDRELALRVEDVVNPGHSGLDFATIWSGEPVLFRRGEVPQRISLNLSVLNESVLIDTGSPRETTPELVAWMRGREGECGSALKSIGECTERLMRGESLHDVMREHHKAQVSLGVVPPKVKELVAAIEAEGGEAKIIGAGGRTGGGGMALAMGNRERIIALARKSRMPTLAL